MRSAPRPGYPVVLKVGSSSLTFAGGGVDAEALGNVAGMVASAWSAGFPTVLVTSGAVATGLPILGLDRRPKGLAEYQVAAAVGQSRLMQHYADALAAHGLIGGQVLLTKDVLANRQQYLHSRGALLKMIELGIVPVINENDIVVVDELKFGDNDRLAAIVSHLVSAQLMILLTDTAGLYTDDPRRADDAELLSAVQHTDEILDEVSAGASGPLGSGGIATKVAAARMAAWSGIPTVIGPSKQPDVLAEILAGNEEAVDSLWPAFGWSDHGRSRRRRGHPAVWSVVARRWGDTL